MLWVRKIGRIVVQIFAFFIMAGVASAIEAPPVFEKQWPTPSPWGAAEDETGNVYAVDPVHKMVNKFDMYGALIDQWNSCGTDNPGQCMIPWDIGIDSATNIYVAHQAGITKFDQDGTVLLQFGFWSPLVPGKRSRIFSGQRQRGPQVRGLLEWR